MYVCEGLGWEYSIEKYATEAEALSAMKQKIAAFEADCYTPERADEHWATRTEYFTASCSGDEAQVFFVYKEPETLKESIALDVEYAYYGYLISRFNDNDSLCEDALNSLRDQIKAL